MENPFKIEDYDFGVPLFLETPIFPSKQIDECDTLIQETRAAIVKGPMSRRSRLFCSACGNMVPWRFKALQNELRGY